MAGGDIEMPKPASQPTAVKDRGKETKVMADAKKCAHTNCSCTVGGKEKYCSAACEGAKGTETIACDCGHPNCKGNLK
jgi:hypothetical protein